MYLIYFKIEFARLSHVLSVTLAALKRQLVSKSEDLA